VRALTGALAVGLLTLVLSPQGGGIMTAAYGKTHAHVAGFYRFLLLAAKPD